MSSYRLAMQAIEFMNFIFSISHPKPKFFDSTCPYTSWFAKKQEDLLIKRGFDYGLVGQ